MAATRFEEGLSVMLRHGRDLLILLALADCAGLARRAHDWLRDRSADERGNALWLDSFGEQSFAEVMAFWRTLRHGDAHDIAAAVQAWIPSGDGSALELAFDGLAAPLTVLRRGTVLSELHDYLLEQRVARITESAALSLGQCGDWEHALAILKRAHADGASPYINMVTQSLLWKFAYLQGGAETVLPRLAAVPFNRELPHAAELRSWQLVRDRIRAGLDDAHVPVIATGDQPHGYREAAAMKIAALEGVAAAAEQVRALRGVLEPRTTTMHLVDHDMSFTLTPVPQELFKARVQVAARRKDYAKLSALAQTDAHNPFTDASDVVIDALLEEGDWLWAAEIADQYDPRDRPVRDGFDDTRTQDYLSLRGILAAAAARNGDDAAAGLYLSEYVAVRSAAKSARRPRSRRRDKAATRSVDPEQAWRWPATLLAGTAEGVLPRRLLSMLLPVFRSAY